MMTAAKLRSRIATTLAGNPNNPPITLTLREARELVNALMLKRAETPAPEPSAAADWLDRKLDSLNTRLARVHTTPSQLLVLRAFVESLLGQTKRPERYEHVRHLLEVRTFTQAVLSEDALAGQDPLSNPPDPHQLLAQIRDLVAQASAPVLAAEPPVVDSDPSDRLHLHPAVGELSVRSRNGLLRTGLSSIRQISAMSTDHLLKQPGLGRKSVEEIRAWVERHVYG